MEGPRIEVVRRDPSRESYVVAFETEGRAYLGAVPEELMAGGLRLGDRPSHEDAYRWIAAHADEVRDAIRKGRDGGYVGSPYDRIVALRD